MIITIESNDYDVLVSSSTPSWDSSVEWKQIGGKWKFLDEGSATAKWDSEITISGIGSTIPTVRQAILDAANSGTPLMLKCGPGEFVFGPEIDYTQPVACVLSDSDSPLRTGNMGTAVWVDWSFEVLATTDLGQRYKAYTGALPALGPSFRMVSAERLDDGARAQVRLEIGGTGAGFGFAAPTAEIVYEGDLQQIAQAMAYFQTRRGQAMSYIASMIWPFVQGEVSVSVFVLEVEYNGKLDKAGNTHGVTLLFGRQ